MMRLDKYLCETGFGTRSQVKDLLKKGQVMVNGEVVKKPELKINETTDQILCQGKKASYQKNIYLMLHKPAGVVSATEDNREKTVLDLVRPEDRKNGLFPVGRLDWGLLLCQKGVDKVGYISDLDDHPFSWYPVSIGSTDDPPL